MFTWTKATETSEAFRKTCLGSGEPMPRICRHIGLRKREFARTRFESKMNSIRMRIIIRWQAGTVFFRKQTDRLLWRHEWSASHRAEDSMTRACALLYCNRCLCYDVIFFAFKVWHCFFFHNLLLLNWSYLKFSRL